jgi:hypothetical protein
VVVWFAFLQECWQTTIEIAFFVCVLVEDKGLSLFFTIGVENIHE